MSTAKPKSHVPGVYYRDDGRLRWEVKIRWIKNGRKDWLKTERYPIDPTAKKGEVGHVERARKDAEHYALTQWRSLEGHGVPASQTASPWTLGALLKRYLEDFEKGLIKHKSGSAKATIRMLLGLGKGANKDGFPDLMQVWLKDLTYEHFVGVQAYSLQQQLKDRDGNRASNGSLKRVLTVIRGVFNRAEDTWKIKFKNPLKKIKGLRESNARDRILDEDEWKSIQSAMGKVEQGTRDAITFARFTAARRSEVCKLDWGDINFKKKLALLRDTKSRGEEQVDRLIPVPAEAWEVVLRRAQPENAKKVYTADELAGLKLGGPVFVNRDGKRLRPDTLTQAWSRVCERAGVEGARLHDLRHTRITEMGRFLTAAETARVSGHTDLATFFRYFNPDPVETGRKIEAMEASGKDENGVKAVAKALASLYGDDFGTAITMAVQIQTKNAAGR